MREWPVGCHRDAALWGLICFFLPLLGILILLIAGDADDGEGGSGYRNTNGNMWIRWQALIDVDPDIRAAAGRVRSFGPQYEEQLAEKYLALNDKSALPALVARTLESAGYVEPQPPAQVSARPIDARPVHAPKLSPQQTERLQVPIPLGTGPPGGRIAAGTASKRACDTPRQSILSGAQSRVRKARSG